MAAHVPELPEQAVRVVAGLGEAVPQIQQGMEPPERPAQAVAAVVAVIFPPGEPPEQEDPGL